MAACHVLTTGAADNENLSSFTAPAGLKLPDNLMMPSVAAAPLLPAVDVDSLSLGSCSVFFCSSLNRSAVYSPGAHQQQTPQHQYR